MVALETLGQQYRDAVENGWIASRLSGEIVEDLLHMERSLRRYEVLLDADSLSDYEQVRSEWQSNVEKFSRLPPLPASLVLELQSQLDLENVAFRELRDNGATKALHAAIDELKMRSTSSLDDAHSIVGRDQETFLTESDTLRKRILLASALAIFVAVCCLWLIRRLLARLIGLFERAVLRLGKGELLEPIALDGPGDLRWLGRWLEWLRRRLLSLEKNRAQVLRHVSHELKTPLAALREGASLLAEEVPGPLTKDQARIVSILQNNSRWLHELIDGLLRLQQAGHTAERIGYQKLKLDSLIEQVLETYRLIAGERGLIFECAVVETEIMAGEEALVTIVNNLLSNAVKFSPDGGRVQITLQNNGKEAVLDVQDEGLGVPEQDRSQIFEPFYRSTASCDIAGVGLGLAIAREFVLAHRGTLTLMPSTVGATFCVVLPLDPNYLRAQKYA